jgi:hypothetical protein
VTFVRGAFDHNNPLGIRLPLLCMWDDCEKPGHDEIKVVIHEGNGRHRKSVHYIFCTPTHRDYFRNSHKSYGNLASGDKAAPGLWRP